MANKDLKRRYKNKVVELALKKSEDIGEDYETAIPMAMEEARIELGISDEEFKKMF